MNWMNSSCKILWYLLYMFRGTLVGFAPASFLWCSIQIRVPHCCVENSASLHYCKLYSFTTTSIVNWFLRSSRTSFGFLFVIVLLRLVLILHKIFSHNIVSFFLLIWISTDQTVLHQEKVLFKAVDFLSYKPSFYHLFFIVCWNLLIDFD